MEIYRDVPIVIEQKIRTRTRKGRATGGWNKFFGEVPIGRINPVTKCFEPCFNHRGVGYALRNAKCNRKKK